MLSTHVVDHRDRILRDHRHGFELLRGFRQRLLDRRRITLISILHGDGDDGAGVEVDRMLRSMGEMRAAILQGREVDYNPPLEEQLPMNRLISALCLMIPLALTAFAQQRQTPPDPATDFRVVLLGTGSPTPRPDRFGPSILVEAGSERLVFDCGRSCTTRLWQLRIPLGSVKLFLTHLHSDHTVGIPDLWLTGILPVPFGGRTSPFRVWGPEGTVAMMVNMEKAFDADIRVRSTALNVAIDAKDFTEGVVFQENGGRVEAFKVAHGDLNAFGFRIDYQGHSVVLSGDTRPSDNLVTHAKGADVVVHEVAMAAPTADAGRQTVALLHSTPEQAGAEFSKIRPKLAVYSHFSLFGTPEPTMEELISRTRKTYQGPLEIGEDLMAISIGDSIAIQRIH